MPEPADTPADASDRKAARAGAGWRYALIVVLPLLAAIGCLAFAEYGSTPLPPAGDDSLAVRLSAALPRFLLELLVVLAAAKLAGALVRRIGQPAVIGEMLAGILLGPSLFGDLWPQAQGWLFPAASLGPLSLISQLGVLVFLFAAGAEFDLSRLRGQRRTTLLIAHAGIAVPFGLGVMVAASLHAAYAPAGVSFASFAMFLGVALSVTAFPVLLRILAERGYTQTPIGRLAIACAALSDATAWGILGLIVALATSRGVGPMALSLGLALALAFVLAVPARRAIARLRVDAGEDSPWMIGLVLMILVGALLTEAMGLHALFGAFLAGTAVSNNAGLRRLVVERIEPFAGVLLLPLFFASTGLRTRIDLLDGSEWLLCLGLVVVATIGKLGGTVIAARWSGIARADAWRLGALMNTRGLMELIVLGLGYDLGLIDQRLYAILVVVALATTVMTGPLLGWIDRREFRRA